MNKLITTKQAAELLQINTKTLIRMYESQGDDVYIGCPINVSMDSRYRRPRWDPYLLADFVCEAARRGVV